MSQQQEARFIFERTENNDFRPISKTFTLRLVILKHSGERGARDSPGGNRPSCIGAFRGRSPERRDQLRHLSGFHWASRGRRPSLQHSVRTTLVWTLIASLNARGSLLLTIFVIFRLFKSISSDTVLSILLSRKATSRSLLTTHGVGSGVEEAGSRLGG